VQLRSNAARELLAERGYDPVLGARPLRRTIQLEIEDTLSEKILFKEIGRGETIKVDVKGEGKDAEFTFEGIETESLKPGEGEENELAGASSGGSGGSSETSA
jgi:ATP-dependent Clp protease ATP-binding subunit ClpC